MAAALRRTIDGRYTVLRRLGEGGMGTVYLVADTLRDSSHRALKLIPRERLAGPSLRYFRNEFRTLARLRHPNLTEVFDFGATHDGAYLYYTSEFVDGAGLRDATAPCRDARSSDEAGAAYARLYDLLAQVARALEHVHESGFIHFDVKPENLLVARAAAGPGVVKLLDFGLSSERAAASRPGLRGTLAYMAPEVIRGDPVDRRADLYSLGATLYAVTTGRPPFDPPSAGDLERMHLEAEPVPPRAHNSLVPPPLEKAILRLLRKDPGERFASAAALVRAIRVFGGPRVDLDLRGASAPALLRASFVGREEERRALGDDLAAAEAARGPRLAVLRGEAGIGKTRLAREVRHRAQLRGTAAAVVEVRRDLSARAVARAIVRALEAAQALGGAAREEADRLAAALAPGAAADDLAPAALGERLARVACLAAGERPLALFLEALDDASPDAAPLLARLLGALSAREAPPRLFALATARAEPLAPPLEAALAAARPRVLRPPPLAPPEIARFVESALGFAPGTAGARVRHLARLVEAEVGGNPLRMERTLDALARAGAISAREGRVEVDLDAIRRAGAGAARWRSEIFARSLDGLDPEAARTAERLAIFDGPVDLGLLREAGGAAYGALLRGIDELKRRDLVILAREEGRPPQVRFRHEALRAAARARIEPETLRRLHDAALAGLERRAGHGTPRGLVRIARHALAGSDPEKALRYALAAADRARERSANETARELYAGALEVVPADDAATRTRVLEELGRLDEVAGRTAEARERYLGALAAAERIPAGPAREVARGRLFARLGSALTTLRDVAGARKNLHEALRTLPREAAAERAPAIGRLAWLAFFRNRHRAALRLARRGLRELRGGVTDGPRLRARLFLEGALGAFFEAAGDLEEAAARHVAALALARRTRELPQAVQALGNLGRVARKRGDLATGARLLRRAARWARRAGLAEAEGQVLQNLGSVEWARGRFEAAGRRFAAARAISRITGNVDMESSATSNQAYALERRGEYGEALALHQEALERARRAGRAGAELEAELGVASSALALGEHEAAARALEAARALLARASSRELEAEVLETEARLRRAEGRANDALAAAERARALRRDLPPSLTASVAALERAELLAELRDPGAALLAWREARASARGGAAPGEPGARQRSRALRARAAFVRGAIALAEGRHGRAARSFFAALGTSPEKEDVDLAWRACRALALALEAAGDRALADAWAERGARIVRDVLDRLPPGAEERFRAREGVRDLLARQPARGAAGAAAGPDADELTETLLEVNRAIAGERERDRLLEKIIDAAIRLAGAERGFIMLASRSGKMKFAVGRSMAREDIRARNAISRTVVARACETGERIVLADARRDPEFRSSQSIAGLQLASVLCTPLRVEGKTAGVLYVDHRFRSGAFLGPQVRAIEALADQAAIALENARLLRAAKRARHEVEELAARLEEKVVRQDRELVAMRRTLESTGAEADLRRRYEGLIGASPLMTELFRVLDRVTDSALPVLVQGESGTGKELVARAIHLNGARRLRPFVVENCSAIPEALLEAELFGAKKGAYTGSVADRPGLFEVAAGGTLFLDEVGDMSLAMQAKLLRALETGQVRPVGSARTIRTDARIIAATNKDLRAEIEAGRFREDLFYRLNVLSVTTPPLRERPEDVPLLVDHFLERIARARKEARKKALAPGVLDSLVAYRWPGNVRELLHEVERAAQLSDETIGLEALSPQVRGGARDAVSLATIDGKTLDLAIRAAERRVILAALAKADNNKTRAAALLGISRYGLQKRMARCDIA
jgi:transcriptional regulator with GAF, ATPase, and Fis domain